MNIDKDKIQVLIEEPSIMSSEKGTVTARSGALIKLAMYAGMVTGFFLIKGYEVILIPVASWKGSLPKEVTKKRVMGTNIGAEESKASHYYDAIGIGLYGISEGIAVAL